MAVEGLPENVFLTTVDAAANWARSNSLWPMPFATACCGIELMATAASRHDMARFGAEVMRFSPRQADLLIVAGRVAVKMLPVLQRIYQQMTEPKWVISMGACASTGGVFDTYAVVQGVDQFIPVDVYVPGCPPRPEMLIDAILKLHEKVMAEPLGPRRQRAIEAQEARHGAPIVAAGAMPSSYRFNKAKKAEWIKAVAEGREEQLRIENWMKDATHTSQSTGGPR